MIIVSKKITQTESVFKQKLISYHWRTDDWV